MKQIILTYSLVGTIVFFLLLLPFALAATVTTTMTWVVANNFSHTLTYGGACSATDFYFVEADANHDPDADGNAARVRPNSSSAGGAATMCQSSTLAPITVTNNGNLTLNIDGNFLVDFNGSDINAVLKVWMGTGSGCGALTGDSNGWGGWARTCTVTAATDPVTQTTCRNYNQFTETAIGRLTTNLGINDTNQLCFSGDFNVFMSGGNHPLQFVTGSN